MRHRMVDPGHQPDAVVDRQLGAVNARVVTQELSRLGRYDRSRQRIISSDSIPWYRANIGASGDAAYLMRLGTPSSDTAWAMTNLTLPAPAAGRILRLYFWSTEVRTGGTATVRVRIIDGGVTTDYTFADCVIDSVNTQRISRRYLWKNAVAFSASATLEARILTAGTWAPTTADVGLILALGFEDDI